MQLLRTGDNSPNIPYLGWNGAVPSFTVDLWQPRFLDGFPTEARNDAMQTASSLLSHLNNSTILLLGDSVDRNFVKQFAWIMQSEAHQESFDGSPVNVTDIKAWGQPHVCDVEGGISLTLANAFFYGVMDEVDDFSSAPDWLPPGKAEDRVDVLFKPFADRLERPVSLIQLHAGSTSMIITLALFT